MATKTAEELKICDRCGKHAGIGIYDNNWGFTPEEEREPVERICLWCAPKVSVGHRGQPKKSEVHRQAEADRKMGINPRWY